MRKRTPKKKVKEVKKKGRKFRSKFEANVDTYIQKKNLEYGYESETLVYTLNYYPDFIIETQNGKVYIETKGHFPSEDRMKMLSVKKNHPDLDIRMVFMQDNKINKKSVTRYTDWCEKHGFPSYVVGGSARMLPLEWTDEWSENG